MIARNIFRGILASIVITLVLGGCSAKEEVVTPEGHSGYLLPSSPDKLMANFVTAYASLDLEGYSQILHEDFVFTFQSCDVEKLGLAQDHLTRQEELAVARNMFSRAEVTKDDGRKVPGIHNIEFRYFERAGDWEAVGGFKGRSDVLGCTYNLLIEIQLMTGRVIVLQGRSLFYVAGSGPEGAEDLSALYYQLIGWVDLTDGCQSE